MLVSRSLAISTQKNSRAPVRISDVSAPSVSAPYEHSASFHVLPLAFLSLMRHRVSRDYPRLLGAHLCLQTLAADISLQPLVFGRAVPSMDS